MPEPKKPKRAAQPPAGDEGPVEDFQVGQLRCLRCGAAFATRAALDRHTEKGHSLQG